jgi:hypothetical protein
VKPSASFRQVVAPTSEAIAVASSSQALAGAGIG